MALLACFNPDDLECARNLNLLLHLYELMSELKINFAK